MIVRRSVLYVCVVVSFVIAFSFSPLADPSQVTPGVKEKLDVLLVIDDSESMRGRDGTDPERIRYQVASAFVGFLKLNTDTIDSRVGVMRFGWRFLGPSSKAIVRGLKSSEDDRGIRRSIAAVPDDSMGATDFVNAFERVYEHLNDAGAFSSDHPKAVVLLTDGWQDTWLPMDIPAVEEWVFQEINARAERLKKKGCEIFVVYTGQEAKYEERWASIASEGHCYSISSMENAQRALRDILEYLTIRDFGDLLFDDCVKGVEELPVLVEPYLAKIVFTVFKRSGDELPLLTLTSPSGETLLPTSPGVIHTIGDADEGYSIRSPESGEWTATLAGDGCVSAWADRYMYEIEVDTPSQGDVVFVGDPMFVKAYLYDQTEASKTPITSDPKYPLTFDAVVRTLAGKLFDTVLMSPDPNTEGVFSGQSAKAIEEGSYTLEVFAGAVGIPYSLKVQTVGEISAILVPRPTEAFVSPSQVSVGDTVVLVARFTGLEAVTVSTEFVVTTDLVDPDGSQYAESIQLVRTPGKNEYTAVIGHIDEAGNVTAFTDDDPKGKYLVLVTTTFARSDWKFIDHAEAVFCLRHKQLPALGEAFLANRQGNEVNRVLFDRAGEYWLEVRSRKRDVADPGFLEVAAEIRDSDRLLVDSVRLTPDPDRPGDLSSPLPHLGTFPGLWGTQSYSVELRLDDGKTTYGCEFPGSKSTLTFVAYEPLLWWIVVAAGVAGGLILFGVIWKYFHPKPPPVGGKLLITNPNGDELPEVDLYGLGARISLGSEGMIMLDSTLDTAVSGVAAEMRAEFVRRRNVVRNVWRREGKRLQKGEDLYNGDVFWVSRYRIQYVNTAAERQAAP